MGHVPARRCEPRLISNCSFRQSGFYVFLTCLLLLSIVPRRSAAQQLQVSYGGKGVQAISFGGTVLEDVGSYPGDSFHIWHMKSTDLQGNVVSSGQYGWGESNNGSSWNAASNTETYNYVWGSISTTFVQKGNNLDVIVTETNRAGSGIIFDGAEIYPFALHFPQDPAGFSGYTQYAITTTGPGVSAADFGSGVVTSVIPDESKHLYGGWKNAGSNTYTPLMTGTAPDGLPTFLPRNDQAVQPGTSLTYTVSLRFTPEGTAASASDAYGSFAATYPSQMTWTDKRIIGTAYLASSPSGTDVTQPSGFPTNPRRYFNDPGVNITTPSGLQSFQDRMLAQAASNVTNALQMNGQGVITWDLEGEEYPQTTTYVCSPDQIAAAAPEMESVVTNQASPYRGTKLVDAYFKTMTSAGLKVGVCLRPQVFTLAANGTASQVTITGNAAIIANLENKAKYANAQWGVTLFYIDSTVDANGGTLDPAIFQQLITDMPSFLFVPEESTPRYYAYSAPFYSFIFHQTTGTPASIYNIYPKAFGLTLVNDVSAATLAQYQPQLTQSVAAGDILMGHADYWQANDATLVAIYQAAGVTTTTPVKVTPVISWAAPGSLTYGTPLSSAQLNAASSAAGSFVYTPPAGTVLGAGANTLLATFNPTDTQDYTAATASVPLTVAQAPVTINWPAPAAITYGNTLTSQQLNASASVPGTFAYTPSAGSLLNAGSSTLKVTFAPGDATDYLSATAQVPLTVARASPQVTWDSPSSVVSGTPLSSAQLNASANVSGAFTYSPPAGTVLPVGTTALQAVFTPSDLNNYQAASATVSLNVTAAALVTPSISWSPATLTYGTALGPAQLNASASVPGSFTYVPAAGTVLNAGTAILRATFTPTDSTKYQGASATGSLTIAQGVPTITWPAPQAITTGTPLGSAQLNASASVPGSFTYAPPAGTVLAAGTSTLLATFTPADSADYQVVSATSAIRVGQAVPVITWPAPQPIIVGAALGPAQLNATASVPGTFTYSPSPGTVLPVGTQTINAFFTPADAADYTSASASVTLAVNAAPVDSRLYITTPGAGAVLSGSVVVSAQCTLPLDAAGTFLMVDGVEIGTRRVTDRPFNYPLDTTTWSNGPHILQIWAHDIGNNTTISTPITVNISN